MKPPKYPKPDTRPDHRKAPKKRKARTLELVDGATIKLYPSPGRVLRGIKD